MNALEAALSIIQALPSPDQNGDAIGQSNRLIGLIRVFRFKPKEMRLRF